MNKFFALAGFLLLFSCSQDCSKCESQLQQCMMTQTLPVDLPQPEPTSMTNDVFMTVEVTPDNV